MTFEVHNQLLTIFTYILCIIFQSSSGFLDLETETEKKAKAVQHTDGRIQTRSKLSDDGNERGDK